MVKGYNRKRHDTAQPFGWEPAYSDGSAINLDGATVKFIMAQNGVVKINATAEIVDGQFFYAPTDEDVDTAGLFMAEWEVTYEDGTIETFPSDGEIPVSIRADLG